MLKNPEKSKQVFKNPIKILEGWDFLRIPLKNARKSNEIPSKYQKKIEKCKADLNSAQLS